MDNLRSSLLPVDIGPLLTVPARPCALCSSLWMRGGVPLARFAPFDINFAPRSSIVLAAAPPELVLQLFKWSRERLSEIHASVLSM